MHAERQLRCLKRGTEERKKKESARERGRGRGGGGREERDKGGGEMRPDIIDSSAPTAAPSRHTVHQHWDIALANLPRRFTASHTVALGFTPLPISPLPLPRLRTFVHTCRGTEVCGWANERCNLQSGSHPLIRHVPHGPTPHSANSSRNSCISAKVSSQLEVSAATRRPSCRLSLCPMK